MSTTAALTPNEPFTFDADAFKTALDGEIQTYALFPKDGHGPVIEWLVDVANGNAVETVSLSHPTYEVLVYQVTDELVMFAVQEQYAQAMEFDSYLRGVQITSTPEEIATFIAPSLDVVTFDHAAAIVHSITARLDELAARLDILRAGQQQHLARRDAQARAVALTEEITAAAEAAGNTDTLVNLLDGLVLDIAASEGSDVNNGGVQAQVAYLLEKLPEQHLPAILRPPARARA